jgi:hypothetical protein
VQELIGQKLVEALEKILWEDEAAECPPLRLADTEWTRQVLQLVMATISKQRQNEASTMTLFAISKPNEPSYSRTCQDRSEAYPAYSTPY